MMRLAQKVSRLPSLFMLVGLAIVVLSMSKLSATSSGICGATVKKEISTGQYTLLCINAESCPELEGNCPTVMVTGPGPATWKTCECPSAQPTYVCNAALPLTIGYPPICLNIICGENFKCVRDDDDVEPPPPTPPTHMLYKCDCFPDEPEPE